MNQRLLVALSATLLGLFYSFGATAQTTSADTARARRHQFGLTASPQLAQFFTANRSLPIGLFYQRQLTPTKALRLRLMGLFSYADSTNSNNLPNGGIVDNYLTGPSYRRWQVQVLAGYAWQHPLGRKTTLEYGLELGLGYQRLGSSSARRYIYQPGGYVVDYDERTTQNWQAQVRPFTGLSFRPTSRLRLFAEMALPLTYTHQRSEHHIRGTFTKPDEVDRFLDEHTLANRLTLAWRPIQLVGAAYAF